MESLIRSNLVLLCSVTTVSEMLLLFLIQHELITQELKEEIESSSTSVKKASLLYEYFMKRPDSDLEVIVEKLELSGNARAVEILIPGRSNVGRSTAGCIPSSSNRTPNVDDISALRNFKASNLIPQWPISHGITLPVKTFIGREKELKKLNSFFKNKQNLVLVCGMGGIGKTELCRKFMKNKKSFFFGLFDRNISRIWLHGDTRESFKSSIFSLASALGVKSLKVSLSESEMFELLIKVTLRHSKKMLVVIDNVDAKLNKVSKIIKMVRTYENISIILTSRNTMIIVNAGEILLLDVLSRVEARKILRNCINNISDGEADSLCKLVQNFPLALQQAIAYVKEQRENCLTPSYSVFDYVKEFEEKKLEMLDQRLNEFEHDYAMTTLVTWNITFNKLSEDAIEVLKILAFLEPDTIWF